MKVFCWAVPVEAGEVIQGILKQEKIEILRKKASYYDYLEVQPIGNNQFLLANGSVGSEEELKDIVRRVIQLGTETDKPVVATTDLHYLNPEDEVYRRIMLTGNGFTDAEQQPPLYFRTTQEMLDEFSFLNEETAREIVVDNSRMIAEWMEDVPPVPDGEIFPGMAGFRRTGTSDLYGESC